jgi:protein O-GlcNAc transferase
MSMSDGGAFEHSAAVPLLAEGCALLDAGRTRLAVEVLGRAADASPDDPAVLERLAEACVRGDQYLAALKAYDRIIELGAATAETWCATGNALADVGEYAQAVGAFENGIDLGDGNAEAHHNLARVLYRLGDVDRAAAHLHLSVSEADAAQTWMNLATLIPGAPGADHQRILDVRTAFADSLAGTVGAPTVTATPDGPRAGSDNRLRIGYLSAFFHSPNYMKPVWALVNHHDRDAFEIHLFCDSDPGKGMPGYREEARDRVHATGGLTNEELAGQVRREGIDVLVDLNAYSAPERLPLFLLKPAPVTVAWFNMYATSGFPGYDYIVGDDEVIRPDEEPFYMEKVRRLPVSYLTFTVDHPCPPVVPPPCTKEGFITFGSLVSQYKITPPVLDAWAEIVRRAPGARLLLANAALKSPQNRQYVVDRFADRGVGEETLLLCGPADHMAFLRYYDRIDIALDAFPYNGGTTTMEAIWQGLPVLTFDGDRWASRTSQTLLRRTHLGEFVADSAGAMVERAVAMANDPETPSRLGALRHGMRERLSLSSACDAGALAGGMEALYREVWGERAEGDDR